MLILLKKNGEKFAQNLIDAIAKSKENELNRLISALGIRHIGSKAAKILAKKYTTMDRLMNASSDSLAATEEIGEISAQSLIEFFIQDQTIDLINRLKQAGVNMTEPKVEPVDDRFAGKVFVLTGTLESYSRDEASKIIESYEGKVSSTVSKKTSYVLKH